MWSLTTCTRPRPHSGGVRHSLPVARKSGRPIGELVAHVVEQHVGVREDRLVRELGEVGERRRSRSFGMWQLAQPALVEQRLAAQHVGVA